MMTIIIKNVLSNVRLVFMCFGVPWISAIDANLPTLVYINLKSQKKAKVCSISELSSKLQEHIEKMDPRDVMLSENLRQ